MFGDDDLGLGRGPRRRSRRERCFHWDGGHVWHAIIGSPKLQSALASAHGSVVPCPLWPLILIISIASVALAVVIRHRIALLPVVAAGLVLYWGMYMQAAPLAMYSSVLLGLAALVASSLWSFRRRAPA